MQELHLYDACPLCGSPDFALHKVADCSAAPLYKPPMSAEMRWTQCGACAHVFRDGYYTDAFQELIFSAAHENQRVGHDLEGQRIVSAQIIDKITPFQAEGDWLDVGFGNAALLLTAAEYGFTPVGIDLRQENVRILRALGVEAYADRLEDLDFSDRFAVLSMADVLEHVPYPGIVLKAAHKAMASGGILFLSMPNSESMIWRTLDRLNQNPYWTEIEHYHNFGRQRLYELLEEYGFSPLRYGISMRYRACMEILAVKQ